MSWAYELREEILSDMGVKRKGLWTVLAIILAVLTVGSVLLYNGGRSIPKLVRALCGANPFYIALSVICMAGIIFWEGEALLVILKGIGYPRKHMQGLLYSAGDVYFSAITPSASGGQPASAFFMNRDGLPVALATAVLLLNLILYTVAVLVLTWCSILFHPQLFLGFRVFAKILIVAGTLALGALSLLIFLLLKKQRILFVLAKKLVRLLSKVRFIHHPERILKRLVTAEKEYQECVRLMGGKKVMIMKAFLCNVLQRLSQLLVTVTVYLALGGTPGMVKDVYIIQCLVTLGSNCVPVPGGMGIADYLMLNGYSLLMGREEAFALEMIGRSFSFYICTLLSGVVVAVGYFVIKRKEKGKRS